jgi:hypothetical protein
MRERSLRLVASSSATRIRSLDFLAILSLDSERTRLGIVFFPIIEKRVRNAVDSRLAIARQSSLYLAIVSGPTMNYNG